MIRSRQARRPMDIATLLETQFFLLRTGIRDEKTRAHYRRAVRWLGELLGRPARLDDLTDDHLSGVLQWLTVTRNQSATTANGARKCLACLWRWCRDRGLLTTGPTVEPLRTPIRTPRAWRREELSRLLAAARTSPGSIGGLPASTWWLTLLALSWDTGARAAELLSLRWEWIDWETGWLSVPAEARKGQHHDEVYGLADDTRELLASIRRPTGLVLGWTRDRSRYWQLWGDLLTRAGLPSDRRHKTQCLRRTFATWLEVGGGSATDALGHGSRATTTRSYLDPTLTRTRSADRLPFRLLAVDSLDTGTPNTPPTLPFRAAT